MKIYVTLSEEEEEVLRLPPKFAIHKTLNVGDMSEAIELAYAKMRYDAIDKSKEDNYNVDDDIELRKRL